MQRELAERFLMNARHACEGKYDNVCAPLERKTLRLLIHHNLISFHQSGPTPNQMTRFRIDIRKPTFHHVRCDT